MRCFVVIVRWSFDGEPMPGTDCALGRALHQQLESGNLFSFDTDFTGG